MERIHERVQKVLVQLTLQIPNGCSQGALHESLKRKLHTNFNNLPYFQVYLHGLGSQLWSLDAKLDNEVQITYTRLRTKIRETILPAFKECLQPADYASFCKWFKKRGNTNKEWMKITEDTVPFPGVPPHFWGVMSDGDTLPDFTADHVNALFGVDGPASGVGGQATAPAPATDQGSQPGVTVPLRPSSPSLRRPWRLRSGGSTGGAPPRRTLHSRSDSGNGSRLYEVIL